MKYRVSVGGRALDVEVEGGRVTVGGRVREAELRVVDGTPLRLLLLDGASWTYPMEPDGRGKWLIQDGGERFEVEVLDERTAHIRSLAVVDGSRATTEALKAPMPGLVVRVLVEPGQEVAPGAGLVVLEAMKMENELKASAQGVVERVEVKPGQAVEKGAVLMSFAQTPLT